MKILLIIKKINAEIMIKKNIIINFLTKSKQILFFFLNIKTSSSLLNERIEFELSPTMLLVLLYFILKN